MTKLASIIMVAILSISYGQESEYSKTLKIMFHEMGTESTYETVLTQLLSMMKKNYTDVDEVYWNELEKEMINTGIEDLVYMLTPVYEKYLTQEDLEGITAFYRTPIGQKYATNAPAITQDAMLVGQEWGTKIGQKIAEKMENK